MTTLARGAASPRLLFVSVGLGNRGGGIAAVGRLLLRETLAWATSQEIEVDLLHLEGEEDVPAWAGEGASSVRSFGGSKVGLALATIAWQVRTGHGMVVFDFLGTTRPQAWIPGVRRPYLVPLYGPEVWEPVNGDRRAAVEKADVRWSISSHSLTRAIGLNPWLADLRIEVFPPTLEGAAEPPTPSPPTEPSHPFLLMVGRLAEGERHKGHDEVLEAWPRIHRELPAARLVVVGEGDDRERLEGKARRLDVAGSVDFRGFVPDAELDALYGGCRALVLPSRGEGFGLVYLEAMRHGRPCVAALGGPAEEIFEDSVSGLLVDPGDPEELHAALAGLLESPALADRLGRAALETYRERHSMEVFRSRFHPLLEAMLERLRD